jgi:hypothetical protein
MTKKKTTKSKPQPYPIEYVLTPNKEDQMDVWGITRQVRRLADAARSAERRWDHAIWQVDGRTIVLVLVAPGSDTAAPWGVYLAWAEFSNDDQKAAAVKALRREVGKWAKMNRLEPQPAKQLELSATLKGDGSF